MQLLSVPVHKNLYWRLLWLNLVLMVLYFYLGELAFSLDVTENGITRGVFLPEGIALAFAILFGAPILPGIFIGQFLLVFSDGVPWLFSITIALGNTLEAALAVWIFRRWPIRPELDNLADLVQLFVVICCCLQPLSAILGVLPMWLGGFVSTDLLASQLFYWWLGNCMGQLLLTPLVLSWSGISLYRVTKSVAFLEYLLVATVVFVMSLISFGRIGADLLDKSLYVFLVMFPLLTLSAVRYQVRGASVFCLLAMAVGLYATLGGHGAFSQANQASSFELLYSYIIIVTITSLFVGAIFAERKRLYRQLKKVAHTDALTGAANRRAFINALTRHCSSSQRYGTALSLVLLDLDKFKPINDRYGHEAGDFVLKQVVNIVHDNIRQTDFLGRLGGDEFVILLPNTPLAEGQELVQRLRRALAETERNRWRDVSLPISASIGLVQLAPGESAKELLHRADSVMYENKQQHSRG